jgi:hypothetical protein
VRFGRNYSFRGQERNPLKDAVRRIHNYITTIFSYHLQVRIQGSMSSPISPAFLAYSTSHIHKLARLSLGLFSKPFSLAGVLSALSFLDLYLKVPYLSL